MAEIKEDSLVRYKGTGTIGTVKVLKVESMAATVLLKMAAYTGETCYRDRAEEALASLAGVAARRR